MFLKLFLIFFRMGLFTFGGGYAMVPIMEKELVERSQLLSDEDFLDYLSVAQSFPGPIAVNLSILIGYKLSGLTGALFSLLGVTLPSFLIIVLISLFYAKLRHLSILSRFFSGVYPVIPALLLLSFYNLSKKISLNTVRLVILAFCFIGVSFFQINPLWFIGGGVIVGLCSYLNSTLFFSK